MLNAINAKGERRSLFARVQRKKLSKKVKSLSETEERKNDTPFLLYPFMKEWDCIEPEFIERVLATMETMGIQNLYIASH